VRSPSGCAGCSHKAANALEQAGHSFEVDTVGGFKHVPFSRRGRRDEIRAGSNAIVEWARANAA